MLYPHHSIPFFCYKNKVKPFLLPTRNISKRTCLELFSDLPKSSIDFDTLRLEEILI